MATNNICNDLISEMQPACDALKKVGGVNKRVWIGKKSNISYTEDSNGYISSISMGTVGSVSSKLYVFSGKEDKNSFTFPMTAGENVNTWLHTAILLLYYSTPSDLEALNQLANCDDSVVIMKGNDDKFYILGLGKGLKGTAGEGGSGILLNDSTAYSLTLSRDQMEPPHIFRMNASSTPAQIEAYLDNLAA